VGKLKAGPDRELFERYWTRLGQAGRKAGLTQACLVEIAEGRAPDASMRKADEARRLLAALPENAFVIVLDERGKAVSTPSLADVLRKRLEGGSGSIAFLIGGPDGHGQEVRACAQLTLALGSMTLPHGLVRIVLAEQLYRCATILTGHPYHRQ
jgi:23S rRNA (pseudouridine1915-N3)-methyltransferase